MSVLAQLIPEVKSLSRVDKLRLIQILAKELGWDEGSDIKANEASAMWSLNSALNAADVILHALATEARS